jgi:uncharacterized GH25 family protein
MRQNLGIVALPGLLVLLSTLSWAEPARINPAAQPSAPQKHPEVSLTGRIVDSAGKPVPEAEVRLQPSSNDQQMGIPTPDKELRVTSDADGRFRFPHLDAGHRDLRIERKGFAPVVRRDLQVAEQPLDLGDLRLTPEAVFEGRVTDERGKPVEGASVFAGRFDDPFLTLAQEDIRTGPDGRFRITGLAPGQRFDLTIDHPDYAPFQAPGLKAPAVESFQVVLSAGRTLSGRVVDEARRPVRAQISRISSQRVSLGNSSSSSMGSGTVGWADEEGRFVLRGLTAGLLDLQFEAPGFQAQTVHGVTIPEADNPAPLEIVLEPEAALTGKILARDGKPIADVWIQVIAADPSQRTEQPAFASTDGDGGYRIGSLGSGAYKVTAQRDSGGPPIQNEVSLRAGETHRLDLTFPSGAAVSGRIVDGAGEPVSGVEVRLAAPSMQFSGTSGADGSFRFLDVAVGAYRLTASGRGYAPAAAVDEVRVTDEEGIDRLELRMWPEARITGRLLGLSGDDLNQVQVTAIPEPLAFAMSPLRGTVDAAGRYHISSLGPGAWRVSASVANGRQVSGIARVGAPGEEVTLDLELPRGLTLSGRVLLDGEPLAGAEVRTVSMGLEGQPTQWQVTTLHDGSFTVEGLLPGPLTLAVVSSEGIGQARRIELAADLELSFDILTGRAGGHVVTIDGQPLEGVIVAFQGEDPDLTLSFSAPQVRTDERGAFEVPRLAAGSYRITAQAPGFGPASQRVTVTPGGTTEVQVVLKEE